MTAMLDRPTAMLHNAIHRAEQIFAKPGPDVVMQRRITIHQLSAAGVTAPVIAGVVGINIRNVERAKKLPLPEDIPALPDHRKVPADRAAELEKLAEIVTSLAFRLRTEDPRVVQHALSLLSSNVKDDLLIIALAGINVDAELTEIYSWLLDLPAAKEES